MDRGRRVVDRGRQRADRRVDHDRIANAGSCSTVRSSSTSTRRASASSSSRPPCTRSSSSCGPTNSPTPGTSSITAPARRRGSTSALRSNEVTTPGRPRSVTRCGSPVAHARVRRRVLAEQRRVRLTRRVDPLAHDGSIERARPQPVGHSLEEREVQHARADEQRERHRHRDVGRERRPPAFDLAQRHEGVDERGQEGADRVLGQDVAAEPQHEPRRVLPGRELDDDEHAGEHEARERDHPGRRRGEDVARRADADVGPGGDVAALVELRHQQPEQDRGDEVQNRHDDQAVPVAAPHSRRQPERGRAGNRRGAVHPPRVMRAHPGSRNGPYV